MMSTAEKEFQKLLRRIEKRRVRVPQILEQLNKTQNLKEKKKLEEELRLLMRKSDRDNLLLNRYLNNQTTAVKSEDEEEEEKNKKTNSASCNSLSLLSEDKEQYRKRVKARESGYSSCGDDNIEHISKVSSVEDILNQPEDEATTATTKSNIIDKILIDSSNCFTKQPKLPNLRIALQKSSCKEEPILLNRQESSKLDELMIEVPRNEMYLAHEISVNSSSSNGSEQPRLLSVRSDTSDPEYFTDAPDNRYNPNRSRLPGFNNSYSGRGVPLGSTSSGGSAGGGAGGSYRAMPINTSSGGGAGGSYNANQSTPRQQQANSTTGSSINISPIGGSAGNVQQSTASSSLIRPASNDSNVNQRPNPNDFKIEYVNESNLGENYMQTYQVERDPQTGQYFIINYLKKVKYIIVPDSMISTTDINNNNTKEEVETEEKQQQQQQERIVEYVDEADLDDQIIDEGELIQDPDTGEPIIINQNNSVQQWVILPSNWRESEDSPYLAREDVNLTGIDVFVESITKRKYIIDEKTGNKYYLINSIGMSQNFKEKWAYFSQLKSTTPTKPPQEEAELEPEQLQLASISPSISPEPITPSPPPPVSDDQESFYVDEKTLKEIDLTNANIIEDSDTGDVILFHSTDPNTRWIVLPNDWQLNEQSNFVDEQDLNLLEWDVFVDEKTRRKYVIDEKTGQKFFIVDSNQIEIFKQKWQNLVQKTPTKTPKHISFENNANNNENGLIEKFENEPSNFKLRSSLKNSPERDNNLKLKKFGKPSLINEPTKLIIKQPGKMGHSIDKSKVAKSPAVVAQRTQQQQNALRAQQEAARRAFLNQKMPSVGQLWIHQMLIDNQRKARDIKSRISHSTDNRADNDDDDEANRNRKHWKSLTHLDDPTMDAESALLDRNRLADVQINGYNKYDKRIQAREKIDYNEDTYNAYWKDLHINTNSKSNNGFGGGKQKFVRGILTEEYKRSHQYSIQQLNSQYRALVPKETLQLKQQFLLTPRYLKDSWQDQISHSYKLKPKIILINDNERILTANKSCNVYVQFEYDNDSVRGANPMYQFMLPECGPVAPTRPLLITPGKIDKLSNKLVPPARQVDLALRDAPVYVYHQDGSAFYENIAQYLAGRYPQLSPKTARKILQFADMKEFEDYLASKITREEAKKISELSGSERINIDSIRKDLNLTVNKNNSNNNSVFYHTNCEYDPLRNVENIENIQGRSVDNPDNNRPIKSNETHQIQVGGKEIKSTFIGFKPTGQVEQLKYEELPQDVRRALQQIPQLEQKFFADSKRKRLIPKI